MIVAARNALEMRAERARNVVMYMTTYNASIKDPLIVYMTIYNSSVVVCIVYKSLLAAQSTCI